MDHVTTKLKALSSTALPPAIMTPAERRAGRFLRAPDHDASTGGGDTGDTGEGADAGDVNDANVEGETGDDAGGADQQGDDADDDGTALGGKGEEEKGGDEPPAGPPEAYELTAPEGMTLDADMVAEATPVFKELNLSNDAAQKLMPVAGKFAEKIAANAVQGIIDRGNEQRKAWLDTAKKDPEIGGGKWDASLHAAGRGLDALGFKEGSDFRKALNETGFGNHPDMIRAFAKVGQMVGEDGDFVRSDAGASVKVPAEDRWYGSKE